MESTSRTLKKVARRGSLLASAPVRSISRRSPLATGTPLDACIMEHPSRRRDSLLGAEPPTEHAPRRRRNSMLGSAPAGCGMVNGHQSTEKGTRRRNSLLGSTPAACGMGKTHYVTERASRSRRSSFLGATPVECGMVKTHPVTEHGQRRRNLLLVSPPAEYGMASNKPRRRRNSLLGSDPAECGIVMGVVKHARRNSLFGNNPVQNKDEAMQGPTADKCRRRNSLLFGSSSNRRASLSNVKSMKNCVKTARRDYVEPLTDMDACIVGPRSA
jgi:hypothetical protein